MYNYSERILQYVIWNIATETIWTSNVDKNTYILINEYLIHDKRCLMYNWSNVTLRTALVDITTNKIKRSHALWICYLVREWLIYSWGNTRRSIVLSYTEDGLKESRNVCKYRQ